MPAAELQPLKPGEERIGVKGVGGAEPHLTVTVKVRFRSAKGELPFVVTNWELGAWIGNVQVPVRSAILEEPRGGESEGSTVADHDLVIEIPASSDWLSRVERIRRTSPTRRVRVGITGNFWCIHYGDSKNGLQFQKVPFTPESTELDSQDWSERVSALGWTPSWAIEFPQPPPVGWERVVPLLASASAALATGTPEGVTKALTDCRSAWLEAKKSYQLGGQRWMDNSELRALYNALFAEVKPSVTGGYLTKEQRLELLSRGVDLLWNVTRNFSEIGVHPEGISADSPFEVTWDDAGLAYRLTFCLLSYLSSPSSPTASGSRSA